MIFVIPNHKNPWPQRAKPSGLRVMWPGCPGFPSFLLYSSLQPNPRFPIPLSPFPAVDGVLWACTATPSNTFKLLDNHLGYDSFYEGMVLHSGCEMIQYRIADAWIGCSLPVGGDQGDPALCFADEGPGLIQGLHPVFVYILA